MAFLKKKRDSLFKSLFLTFFGLSLTFLNSRELKDFKIY